RPSVPVVRAPHGAREPAVLGVAVWAGRGTPQRARRRRARPARPERPRRPAGVVAVARAAAAGGDREGAGTRSHRVAARRAVHGARPRGGGTAARAAGRAARRWGRGGRGGRDAGGRDGARG